MRGRVGTDSCPDPEFPLAQVPRDTHVELISSSVFARGEGPSGRVSISDAISDCFTLGIKFSWRTAQTTRHPTGTHQIGWHRTICIRTQTRRSFGELLGI
jgi:hypothetical protein